MLASWHVLILILCTSPLAQSLVLKHPVVGTPDPPLSIVPAEVTKASSHALTIDKRQVDLYAARQAVLWYRCPILGQGVKVFKWGAHYKAEEDEVQVIGLKSIDSWDHVHMVTNDFLTTWHHRTCKLVEQYCCVYSFQGSVVGSIHDDRIEMDIVTARMDPDPAHRVQVTEVCVRLAGDLICQQQVCPVRDVYQHGCVVDGVVTTSA